jgi:hypothetical protein
MPRSSSSSSSRSSNNSFSRSPYTPAKINKPVTHVQTQSVTNNQPQIVQHQVQSPSIGTSIKDGIASGFGWGIGTSIARNIFGGNSTPTQTNVVEQPKINNNSEQNSKCGIEQNEFLACLKTNGSGMCYELEEKLKKCIEK